MQQHSAGRATDALFAKNLIGQPTGALVGRNYSVEQHPTTGEYWWVSHRGGAWGSTLPIPQYTADDGVVIAACTEVCAANEWFPKMEIQIAETGDPVWLVEIRMGDQQSVIGRGYAGVSNMALAVVRALLSAAMYSPVGTRNAA